MGDGVSTESGAFDKDDIGSSSRGSGVGDCNCKAAGCERGGTDIATRFPRTS